MLNLAFSTNAFKKNTLEEAIQTIARIGYSAVEIMADVPHAYPPQMHPARRLALRELLQRHRLRVSNINAFTLFACGDTYHPTWFEEDLGKRELRIMHTLMCIEMAAELGAGTVSLQPGGPLIGTTLTRRQAAKRFADGLRRVLPAAAKADIILAVEPEPGLFIETAAEFIDFKKAHFKGEHRLAMNCDLGHLFCVGEDPASVLRKMPREIAHVHLEDIAASRVHQHLVPGKGAMDFKAIFAALKEIGYKGYVTVELYPYETTAAGVAKAAWDYLKGVPR